MRPFRHQIASFVTSVIASISPSSALDSQVSKIVDYGLHRALAFAIVEINFAQYEMRRPTTDNMSFNSPIDSRKLQQ
jgi:hypothetical protein